MTTPANMTMVFRQSVTTPLFSAAWTPVGARSYAGTCIFLIFLAVVHRALQAVRSAVFQSTRASDGTGSTFGAADVEGRTKLFAQQLETEWQREPFRLGREVARALMDVLTGGIGYLLMLAVMTMNVGYFLSVLGGIFLGAFLIGRFGSFEHH
ncbi:Ctr copper transporter [Pestalotiopsis sp. NC0098]|nr:Ctr copper transporter [Pestalotiopsis sp. NC0098]